MFALLVSIEKSACSLKHAVATADGSSLAPGAAARFLGKAPDEKRRIAKERIRGSLVVVLVGLHKPATRTGTIERNGRTRSLFTRA